MSKWTEGTPGPRYLHRDECHFGSTTSVYGPHDPPGDAAQHVAEVSGANVTEAETNALLISKSPDMASQLKANLEVMKDVEWTHGGGGGECPVCLHDEYFDKKHAPDCTLNTNITATEALLKKLEG